MNSPYSIELSLILRYILRERSVIKGMRTFNYSKIKNQKWDSEILGYIATIYKEAGKQELYLKQRPEELEKLVEIAKIQSTEASNAIEGIVTTNTRIKQLVTEKTTPKNRDKQEIAGYRDVLNLIHERYDVIPISRNYILQIHKIMYSHMNNPMAGQTKSVKNYISATYSRVVSVFKCQFCGRRPTENGGKRRIETGGQGKIDLLCAIEISYKKENL